MQTQQLIDQALVVKEKYDELNSQNGNNLWTAKAFTETMKSLEKRIDEKITEKNSRK